MKNMSRKILAANLSRLMKETPSLSSQTKLQAKSGVAQATIGRILREEVSPSADKIEDLARAFGKEASELLADQSNVSSSEIAGYVPLISWVQAGGWEETIDLFEPGYSEQVHPTIVPHSKYTFALRVEGDSMTAPAGAKRSFPHGMIIYVDPERRGGVTTGDFVVARLKGTSNATFKQLSSEEGRPILKPLNPSDKYPIIRDEFEIMGKVIDAGWGGL